MDRPNSQEFRELHKALKKHFFKTTIYIPGVDELLNMLLYQIEVLYLDELTKLKVDTAVQEAQEVLDKQLPDLVTPIYTEKESTVEGFPEIRMTAPWYRESKNDE